MEHRLLVWMFRVAMCVCQLLRRDGDWHRRNLFARIFYKWNLLFVESKCMLSLCIRLMRHCSFTWQNICAFFSSSFASCEAHLSGNSHHIFFLFLLYAEFSMRRTWFTLPIELIRFSAVRFVLTTVVMCRQWYGVEWSPPECVHRKGMQSLYHLKDEAAPFCLLRHRVSGNDTHTHQISIQHT